MLSLHNLTVSIGEKKILDNISYTFEHGKVYAIMGPNGSGKSTLAGAVMGNPVFELGHASKIIFKRKKLNDLEPHERAQKGLFMSFQTPIALTGVTIYQLLRYALNGREDPLKIRQEVQKYAKKLHIKEELLSRSLNEGFSGGERKKMEVLQALVLQPELMFFDEIDTGVDVDALKIISKMVNKLTGTDKTVILVTHYNRLLKYVKPDRVLVLAGGRLVAEGDAQLAHEIEKNGYEGLM